MNYYSILLHDAGDRMIVVKSKSKNEVESWAKKRFGNSISVSESKSGDISWYGKERIGTIENGRALGVGGK